MALPFSLWMQGAGVFGPRQPTAGGGVVEDGAGDRFTLRGGSAVLDTVHNTRMVVVVVVVVVVVW